MGGIDRRTSRPDQLAKERSDHLCECGCGEFTMVVPRSNFKRGIVKGAPRRFVYGHQRRGFRKPKAAGGRRVGPPRLCLCGCGEPVSSVDARWRPGHQPRAPRRRSDHPAPIGPARPCACGCGLAAPSLAARYRPSHWLRKSPVDYIEDPATGCWVWQRQVDVHGYGRTGRKGKAHREAYEREVGPIPAGHDIHHRCENKLCVNPAHLEALTPDEHGQLHGRAWRRAA